MHSEIVVLGLWQSKSSNCVHSNSWRTNLTVNIKEQAVAGCNCDSRYSQTTVNCKLGEHTQERIVISIVFLPSLSSLHPPQIPARETNHLGLSLDLYNMAFMFLFSEKLFTGEHKPKEMKIIIHNVSRYGCSNL